MSKRISLSNMTIPEALRALADEYDTLWTEYEGSYSGEYKGAYDPTVQYNLYDRVHLVIDNLVYLAKVKNVGEAGFIVGIPPNEPDSLYWEVITVNFLIRGEQGLQGEKGEKGEQGERGLTGERGASIFVINIYGSPETTTMDDGGILAYGKPVKTNDLLVDLIGNVYLVTNAGIEGGQHTVIYRTNIQGSTGERGASIFVINISGSTETTILPDGAIPGYGKPVKTNDLIVDLIGNVYLVTIAGIEGGNHTVIYRSNIKGEKGEKGDKGDKGDKGEKGDKGDDGVNVLYQHTYNIAGACQEVDYNYYLYFSLYSKSPTPLTNAGIHQYLLQLMSSSTEPGMIGFPCTGYIVKLDEEIYNTVLNILYYDSTKFEVTTLTKDGTFLSFKAIVSDIIETSTIKII